MQSARNDRRMARLWRNAIVLGASDLGVLAVSLVLGRAVVSVLAGVPLTLRFSLFLLPVWLMGAAAAGLLPAWGLDTVEELRRVQLLLLSLFALGGVVYLFGRGVFYPSRLAYAVSWLASAAGIPVARAWIKRLLLRRGVWGCPVVLYGDRPLIERVHSILRAQPELGYLPVGAFTDDSAPDGRVAGLPRLGGLRDRSGAADVAVAPLSLATAQPAAASYYDRTLSEYRRTLLLPEIHQDVLLWVRPRALGGLVGMDVTANLLNPAARWIKRAVDLLLAAAGAPAWLPLLGGFALAIRIVDGHSPFYAQDRIGRDGRRFRILKFRTMVEGADRALAEEMERNPDLRREWDRNRKLKEDPRVTRMGRFLRRWSIDELPQLFQVLTGRMSLVGPRPLPEYHERELNETVRLLRRRVRPGMTGLWQISGRSESGTRGMERWDAYYVRNWSIWLDLVILGRTLRTVIAGQGAY